MKIVAIPDDRLPRAITQAIVAYDDMPRTQWIFKYSAQNTIVVTRTFFTQEVNEAFEELEEGERLKRWLWLCVAQWLKSWAGWRGNMLFRLGPA
eukprot:1161047-Pelagomonas_calceolata.AAC.27